MVAWPCSSPYPGCDSHHSAASRGARRPASASMTKTSPVLPASQLCAPSCEGLLALPQRLLLLSGCT